MEILDYDHERDLKAVKRIWREVGWVDEDEEKQLDDFFACGDSVVFHIDGEAECAVHSTPGKIFYQDEPLALGAVTAVTTSRIARKLGAAQRLTARVLAKQADAGAEVAALGMFEQGFYDRVGFGTGTYEQLFRFDPATLTVEQRFRTPKRLNEDDWPAIRESMLNRHLGHGGCVLDPPEIVKAEIGWQENPFGLGYYEDGKLTHFVYGEAKDENGPYRVNWMAYQNAEQLLELLALLKALGDQVNTVAMLEPDLIQLQDLLQQPFRNRRGTRGSTHANDHIAMAYWQLRILDLPGCLAKTALPGGPLRFNLKLRDPAAPLLEQAVAEGANSWTGCGGDYVVTLGEQSNAEPGQAAGLPTLDASVGAFSRLWFGVRNATALAVTTDLAADPALLTKLDQKIRLPRAHLGWDF